MIWLKENSQFCGYVPMLRREYTEKSIREMSKYSFYDGWSRLSELVMKIQGIGYKFYGSFSEYYDVEPQSLAEICFDFDFECFLVPNESKIEIYRGQILDVFQNLTLYKVEEISEEELKKKVAEAKQHLNYFVSDRTLSAIDYDVSSFIRCAESSFANLSKTQKMLEDMGCPITQVLFSNIDENLRKEIYKPRESKNVLEMGF